ncbi:peroxiredoxin family protein [Aureivirga sp. CE67]|uniref:peroxiredoxin family protein n=1 Tax=Aureivirga sp. CE67 TaxID=1788983 RepID=UPI0018CA6369|nr:TlpA disulfide reductase family protein [Aureivirga sp. CE67]
MRKMIYFLFVFTLLVACKTEEKTKIELKKGSWKGEILMQNETLPFLFDIDEKDGKYSGYLINSEEKIPLNEIEIKNDSVFISMHIFDISLKAKINGNTLNGVYVKNYIPNYELPFTAKFGETKRFENPVSTNKFDGKWDIIFKDDEGNENPAIGVFEQKGNLVKGTFLTPTGDYRYLEGTEENGFLKLVTFDGNHAFIFNMKLKENGEIKGVFKSGLNWIETFTGKKNPDAKLPDANKLTYLKEGYDTVSFSFPNLNGEKVSLDDPKYKDKVVILQIFGTWCPNCMDETQFLTKWYQENKDKDVEIIGLAYEIKDDFNYAKSRVEKMKETFNVPYDFLIAGTANKEEASKTLPMLNKIISFPTTIFIDKNGKVAKIHTGFSGPATGEHYAKFIEEFNLTINDLTSEK